MDKIFHIDGDFLQEDARMVYPQPTHLLSTADNEENLQRYRAHIESLARYPLARGVEWPKKEGLRQTIDFKIEERLDPHELNSEAWTRDYAVPLPPPVAEERTQDELWEDVAVTFGEHEDAREAIKYLQKNYTLAKR